MTKNAQPTSPFYCRVFFYQPATTARLTAPEPLTHSFDTLDEAVICAKSMLGKPRVARCTVGVILADYRKEA